MAKMTKHMMNILEKTNNIVVATATRSGIPNVVPIGAKKILDSETILFSDQFFNKTLSNMRANSKIALTYWYGSEGYQLKGSVTIETQGKIFEEAAKWIEQLGEELGLPLKSKGAVILKIEETYQITPGADAGKRLG